MSSSTLPERTIWLAKDGWSVEILDQTRLPQSVEIVGLRTVSEVAAAILHMQVRGAPLIGVTAAYGMAIAMHGDASDNSIAAAYQELIRTRPTAVNLRWALDRMVAVLMPASTDRRRILAYSTAAEIAEADVATNHAIGVHGLKVIRKIMAARKSSGPLQVMTHCNAGRLATVEWGTATAPIYLAHRAGIPVHVWVSETRPRNQGASLTAWELVQAGVPLTVIADNSAGHLIQRGMVDMVIVGADRVTACGDAANKVGTYLKALAARAHKVPFYVAFPESTIDWGIRDGITEIPIEQRASTEVTELRGISLVPPGVTARNDAFDVTPAKWITGLISEKGVCRASEAGLSRLFGRGTA
jgi:methylthioribose-1-phosphate isomerase